MASALTIVFLGCWLARQSRVLGQIYYSKPSISLRLSRGVALEAAVTIRCQGQHQKVRFLLYKDGNPTAQQEAEPAGDVAEFPIHFVSQRDAGSYHCRYRTKQWPYSWSQPSDPVKLELVDPSYLKPNISLHPSKGITPGGAVTIRCRCRYRGGRVLWNKAGDPAVQRAMDPIGDVAEFRIRNLSRTDAGSYSCQCRTPWDPNLWSEPSDPVELVVAAGPDPAGPQQSDPPTMAPQDEGRSDLTQRITAPMLTHRGSMEPGACELNLSSPIIAGMIAGAPSFLLLLLAFFCYRHTQTWKGSAARQSRESKAADTLYDLVGQGKQQDVLPQEPRPGAEGLTYAELDPQKLQMKRGTPVPAPESVIYSAISAPPFPHSLNLGKSLE